MLKVPDDLKRRYYELFGDPLLASAGLDRLAHRADVIILQGKSFRAQGHKTLVTEGVESLLTQTQPAAA